MNLGVDYQVVVFGIGLRFVTRFAKPVLNLRFFLGSAPAQTALEFGESRWQNKYADRIAGIHCANLARALDVDVEQDVAARGDRGVERRSRRAVGGLEHPRPFGEFAGRLPAFELFFAHKVVIDSVRLAFSRRARCQGYRKLQARDGLERGAPNRGLAGPRRRRKDEDYTAPGRQRIS